MTSTTNASITIGGISGFQSIRTDDGITNKVVLNNFSEITDLIILNNSNQNQYSNITMNFDNKYRIGLFNSNLQFLKYDEILNESDSLLSIDDNDIIINNSNIIYNIHSQYSLNSDTDNILLLDTVNSNINVSNYDFNFYIDGNSNIFNIHNTDNGSNIFGVKYDKVNINCDLIVNKIITKEIDSIDGTGINISSYQIEENTFNKISVGINDYFSGEDSTNTNTPLTIYNNNLDSETSILFNINKVYDNDIFNIFKIDNNGYIYMGNCEYNNKESYITINNSNYNNYLNINNELKNYISFTNDYYSDDFTINKYANITIGSNINNNQGILDINRNDDRINLDINNSNNINENKPLLNLNIDYETKKNYKWYTNDVYTSFFDIFPSKAYNKNDIDFNIYSYIDNYKFIFGLNEAEYQEWKIVANIPINGQLISNENLEIKLREKNNSGTLIFTESEWDEIGITNLNMNNYTIVDGIYFQPLQKKLDSKEMYYHYNKHKYYFLHGSYINAKLKFNFKKLNLKEIHNKNEQTSLTTDYDTTTTYNILYDYYNLKNETEQIEYNFKTYYWKTQDFDYHIFYPYEIVHDDIEYIINIDNISLSIPSIRVKKIQTGLLDNDAIIYNYEHLFIYPSVKDTSATDLKTRLAASMATNRDKLLDYLATDIDIYTSNIFNLDNTVDNRQYFEDFTSIRHVEVRATGLNWKKIDTLNIDDVWDNTTIPNKMNYVNIHPYNVEMQPFQHSSKVSLLNTLNSIYANLDSGVDNFSLSQNIWDTFNIDYLYCNEYIEDTVNGYFFIPNEKIKVVFAIHFPLEFYNNLENSLQLIKDYSSNIIDKPNFINLTSNSDTIFNIDNNGSLIYNYDTFNSLSNYSIYAPERKISTNAIELNEIISTNEAIDFNNLFLNNIAGIQFNTTQEFDVSLLKVDKILTNNNNLGLDNTQLLLNTIIYGLKWKLISHITDIYSYTNIDNQEFLTFFSTLIQNNPNLEEYEIDINNISTSLRNFISSISYKSYIFIDGKYYIQNINEYDYSSNLLLYNTKHINNFQHLFYNNLISINTNNDSNIKPAITIYGNNPSINLKSDTSSNILYQETILQKEFKSLSTIAGDIVKYDVFQINYYDDNNVLFDYNMHENNSKHIIEYIHGDYNILSFGENYNICIDTKGIIEPTFTDSNFGTVWIFDEGAGGTRISQDYESSIISIFEKDSSNRNKNTINITHSDFISVGITDINEESYIIYSGKKFKPYITTYSHNLARNSTNKNHKISLGVPHNNPDINTSINDYDTGLYLYNYPRYFNEIIKNNDYMLNIYGNTKIYGVDGNTNALSININDTISEDSTYKVNLGIATQPNINNFSNTLSIDGNIYANNFYYKQDTDFVNVTNIYNNIIDTIENTLFEQQLNKSYIHTSNINSNFVNDSGIFDLKLIPKIPLDTFATPQKPLKNIYLTSYSHPEVSSSKNGIITNHALDTLNYKISSYAVYTENRDIEKIDSDYNKYFYIVFNNDYADNTSKNYEFKVNDSITTDILIVAGGGGGGYVKPILKWYQIFNPTSGSPYKNLFLENNFNNGIYFFEETEYENIKNSFKNYQDNSDIANKDLLVDNFITNNDYVKIAVSETDGIYKYFRTFNYGGGKGGELSIIKDININKDTLLNVVVGSGGVKGNLTTNTSSTSGQNSSFSNNTLYGGKNSEILYDNNDIHPIIATDIYNYFNIYDSYGINNNELNPTKKYFSGDGNTETLLTTIGGGGGDSQADASQNSGGGGGYFNGEWGNGANGIIIVRYKFNLRDDITSTVINDNPTTNGLLQYNWIDNNWELNYDVIDVSNILINTIYQNSNILKNNIDNFSNIIDNTSNNIIDTILTSNTTIYDNINTINNTININDTNYSNYIKNVYDNTVIIDAERIVTNTINIDRIPTIPFSKFNNLDINLIYSPKINNNIIFDTNYYLSNINYTSFDTNDYKYTEYIILKHDSNSLSTRTQYNLQFQLKTNIDILIVGGGGGGDGGIAQKVYCGGGGGGASILAKNINIELNKTYQLIVGAGGGQGADGNLSSAFGLVAGGGKGGSSQQNEGAFIKGIGGIGGIPITNSKFTEVGSDIFTGNGGRGGSIDATDSTNILPEQANVGNSSGTFINDNDNRQYYWGGGGGYGTIAEISEESNLPHGADGGGGAGTFNNIPGNNFKSSNGISYDNPILYYQIGDQGLNGAPNSGGGGGGGRESGDGGIGGSGIIIIKINSVDEPQEYERKKAYISYNFNLNRWEMNSLDLLNLDININDINETINNSSNDVIDYVNSLVQREEYGYIIVPSNIVTNDSIVNNAIYSYNIFGYNGKSSNLTPSDLSLTPDAEGLITIPYEGYTDPNNIYYKKLIHGNKFANHSITNSNIADNSISSDKLQGTIDGSKLKDLSINYTDITGDIYSHVKIINDTSSSELINVSSFNNITIDISLLDLTGEYTLSGITNIISSDDLIKIPVNKFDNINIDISNIDFAETYSGNITIISDSNDINIDIFDNINIDISNILNYGDAGFKINNATLNGTINKNYLENIFIHSSNINQDTLTNTNVYLYGTETIDAGYIKYMTLSANQISSEDITSTIEVQLRLDGQTIHPSLLKEIRITPQNITYIENSLKVELDTTSEKINPNLLSNVLIIPSDISNIDNYSVKLSHVNIDTTTEKLHPDIIGDITLTPSDIANISDYSVKLSNVIITTGSEVSEKINPDLIASITLTPEQFNNIGSFQSVILDGLSDGSIDPSLINHDSITINANHIKTGINPDTSSIYKFSSDIIYDFPANSIDPSLIPDNVIIYGSNINLLSGNKLNTPIIQGEIKSSLIGDNAIITSSATIIDNGKIDGEIRIESQIDTKIIKNAVIYDGNNINYTTEKIERAYIYGQIDSSYIKDAEIRIDNQNLATIVGDTKFSGNTLIKGNLDSKYISSATIDLNDADTSLMPNTYITGNVTITGIVNSANINPASGVTIDIQDGQFNGSNLANESIPYTKLSSNLNIYVNEIKFSNGTSFTSAISDDIYTIDEVDTIFVSKNYYNNTLAPKFVNNLINLNIYDNGILNSFDTPLYKSIDKLTISTYNTFYSQHDHMSLIEIKSNNNNAIISIVSYDTTEIDKIGNKLLWQNVGGSYFKVNTQRLSFILNNNDNIFEVSNTSNFSYKPLYIPELIFADGTTMNTSAITMLNSENQLIMNNTESGYNYTDNQITGEGFIHCNGIHAEFDITAFSSTTKSDINLKKNINNLEYNNELLELNPVTFEWKDKNKSNTSNVGFIAQDVEKILPILVKDGLDNYKSVNYVSLIPYLVKHIQNLEERIKQLETKKDI